MIYGATALTGGAAGAVDYIDGAVLADKDICLACVAGAFLPYLLDEDSGAAESSPVIIAPDNNPGTKRWILQGPQAAFGAANLGYYVNAAGTAAEWASGVKYGTITRALDAASGDVDYTGIDFKPSSIEFIAREKITSGMVSIGADWGTARFVHYSQAGATFLGSNTHSIVLWEAAGKSQSGLVKTFNANGFTLTWTRDGATSGGTEEIVYRATR